MQRSPCNGSTVGTLFEAGVGIGFSVGGDDRGGVDDLVDLVSVFLKAVESQDRGTCADTS